MSDCMERLKMTARHRDMFRDQYLSLRAELAEVKRENARLRERLNGIVEPRREET